MVVRLGKATERKGMSEPILLRADTGTGYLEQAVWAVIPTDLYRDASITAHRVTLFAEIEFMQCMKRI